MAKSVHSDFPKRHCEGDLRCWSSDTDFGCRKQLEASETVQNEFKQWVVESKRFSEHEKSAISLESPTNFDEYWQNTNNAKNTFDRSSDKGCGLWTRRYQSSAAAVQPFMKDFSPIIDIVKDFGAPYGGIALGTISLLFAVTM